MIIIILMNKIKGHSTTNNIRYLCVRVSMYIVCACMYVHLIEMKFGKILVEYTYTRMYSTRNLPKFSRLHFLCMLSSVSSLQDVGAICHQNLISRLLLSS